MFGECGIIHSMKQHFKRPIIRKIFLMLALGLAGLAVGEVYQRFSKPTAQETLTALGATKFAQQLLMVNNSPVVAEVWLLPEFASADPLKRSRGRTLTMGRMVLVFKSDEVERLRGRGVYPKGLPPLTIDCDYVVETNNALMVNGTFYGSAVDAETQFGVAAAAQGWTAQLPGAWVKEDYALFMKASEPMRGALPMERTRVSIIREKRN